MPNTQTDKLRLATTSTITGGILWFGPAVRVDAGFSLQVFRKTGEKTAEYLGSVAERVESDASQSVRKLGAHDGDLVVRVNLGEHPLVITGTLATSDGYTRTYEATIFIRVSDAPAFAIAYRQETDPVEQARVAIDAELVRWAEWMPHDEIVPKAARFRAEQGLERIKRKIGLSVVRAEKISLTEDPKRAAVREAEQQAIVDQTVARTSGETTRVRLTEGDKIAQAQHLIDVRKQQEERERLFADHQLKLTVQEMEAQHALRASQREQLSATIVEMQQRRLRELLDEGYSLRQIIEEEPELMHGVAELLSTTNALSLEPGTRVRELPSASSGTSSSSQTEESAAVQPGTVRQMPEASEIVNPHLGLTLTQRVLSSEQMQWAGTSVAAAFLVSRLDPGGPAEKGKVQVGDFLLRIDGQPLTGPVELTQVLNHATLRDGIARTTVLRGQEVKELAVNIAR